MPPNAYGHFLSSPFSVQDCRETDFELFPGVFSPTPIALLPTLLFPPTASVSCVFPQQLFNKLRRLLLFPSFIANWRLSRLRLHHFRSFPSANSTQFGSTHSRTTVCATVFVWVLSTRKFAFNQLIDERQTERLTVTRRPPWPNFGCLFRGISLLIGKRRHWSTFGKK